VPSLKNIVTQSIIALFNKDTSNMIDICAQEIPQELFVYLDQEFESQTSLSFFHYFVLMYPHSSSLRSITKLSEYYSLELNVVDRFNETALHKAALWGFVDMVSVLLDHHADVHVLNIHGDTPLHLAALRGYPHELKGTIVSGEYGYLRYDYSFFHEQPLPNAMTFTPNKNPKRGSKKEYAQIVSLLLARGAQTTIQGRYGNIPLHNAADQGFYKGLLVLLNHNKESVHAKNRYQQTALDKVARKGSAKSVELLKFAQENGLKNTLVDAKK